MIYLKVLKAEEGDCFLLKIIEEKNIYNILIDGGTEDTYKKNGLKDELVKIFNSENEVIDLLVLTHIHDDHIGGIKALFEDDEISNEILEKNISSICFNSSEVISNYYNGNKVDFIKGRKVKLKSKGNGTQITKTQGYTLEKAIRLINKELKVVKELEEINLGDNVKITILSPNEETLKNLHETWPDESSSTEISGNGGDLERSITDMINKDKVNPKDNNVFNGSSISFILEYKNKAIEKTFVFLGDSFSKVNLESLNKLGYNKNNKLKAEIMKLSHHGSIYNIHENLLEIIDCKKFIVSTDFCKSQYSIKRGIARVIGYSNDQIELYFNYDKIYDIFGEEYEKYKSICTYVDNYLEV